MLKINIEKIKGIKREISISKIKNINLIKKNWILKGIRVFDIGSNPHSNTEFFSRFFIIFFEIKKFNNIKDMEINVKKINIINILKILIFIYNYYIFIYY